jgi:HK97 family phage major capsid protein
MSVNTAQLVKDYQDLEANAGKLKSEQVELTKELKSAQEKIKELEQQKLASFHANNHGSDERKLLQAFRVPDFKSLLQVNVAAPEYKRIPLEKRLEVLDLKKELDIARIIAQKFYGGAIEKKDVENESDIAHVKTMLQSKFAKDRDLEARLKAYSTVVSGSGLEWVPTLLSANYLEEYELELMVAKLFQEITMPSNPFEIAKKKNGSKAKLIGQNATGTPSGTDWTTEKIIFNSSKFFEMYEISEECNEDSAVDMITIGRDEIFKSIGRSFESAIINGDTTATHMDSDVTLADDSDKAWKGLRKLALQNSANGVTIDIGGAASATKISEMLKAAGKFSTQPRNAVLICSCLGYHQLRALPEVLTVDKMGALATIIGGNNGVLAAIMGVGIVISEYLKDNMNATGVVDGVTTSKTGLLLVNKERFMLGKRRAIRLRVTESPNVGVDQWLLAGYARYDFKGHVQSASEKSVVYGYNMAH